MRVDHLLLLPMRILLFIELQIEESLREIFIQLVFIILLFLLRFLRLLAAIAIFLHLVLFFQRLLKRIVVVRIHRLRLWNRVRLRFLRIQSRHYRLIQRRRLNIMHDFILNANQFNLLLLLHILDKLVNHRVEQLENHLTLRERHEILEHRFLNLINHSNEQKPNQNSFQTRTQAHPFVRSPATIYHIEYLPAYCHLQVI